MRIIRKAIPQDAWGLANVHSLSWQAAYAGLIDPEFLKTRTPEHSYNIFSQNGCDSIWLAEQDGQIIGFCRISEAEEAGEKCGEIAALYLLPQFQHQGIGRQLIEAGIEQLRRHGYPRIVCWVLKSNQNARQFYQRCRFVEDPVEQTLVMGTPQTILRCHFDIKS